ncbi:methylenetetrahydrofolate reductase [NAD(P)H] [Pseudoteredinibacter isoporae]|uniref:Methylenetetrahydrofolate reductase n=1 Tax=Pseudoteredinibacter isoporae TaxID=570281 RepID=A0A7X0MW39_9GAMM|nr:methylenetetrahydrofolate reductase [NAD(P)H] [Pseudoteredinibacter isoporae]MBB6520489.1 methylenetetrahydrofolate reductase (NADPH) [Pseudoteredinibacter isoporae]NHO86056.1 methylenetetrahydrofolate reductase [NAD(P)H] [Pseudoteredinibacter isoporae]NIB25493.1 methylenetetrahydrofolate reductase [NAD(P)H] [Pseudoteredinibacter isoporae]
MSNEHIPVSFEFFPPKTPAGKEKLAAVQEELALFQPEFYSVTYGAGGSTRDSTKGIVLSSINAGHDTAPHLSFGGDDEDTIKQLLQEYKDGGVKRLVALRGDMPSGMGGASQLVYANQLVAFIREHFGDHFHIEVAAYPEIHPEARSYKKDIEYLKGKFDAGANSAITQYFYNPDAYFYFADQCQAAGIEQPIVPGIMPIINYKNLARFSANCGAEIPRWMARRLEDFADDQESIISFGIDLVSDLCEMLLDNGAPGLHFYTMNQTQPTAQILTNLLASE